MKQITKLGLLIPFPLLLTQLTWWLDSIVQLSQRNLFFLNLQYKFIYSTYKSVKIKFLKHIYGKYHFNALQFTMNMKLNDTNAPCSKKDFKIQSKS